ncbi:hypothetical protein [Halomontanus rarus]|uniref:hypothetical protein n=1 Tax=Halomontanus rarus TaxID=3034020 RepID=UPI0023E80ED2|nr:hypothetical protein [Halovivax sp. TS33]
MNREYQHRQGSSQYEQQQPVGQQGQQQPANQQGQQPMGRQGQQQPTSQQGQQGQQQPVGQQGQQTGGRMQQGPSRQSTGQHGQTAGHYSGQQMGGQRGQRTGSHHGQQPQQMQTQQPATRFDDHFTDELRLLLEDFDEVTHVAEWCATQCSAAGPELADCARICADIAELAELNEKLIARDSMFGPEVADLFVRVATEGLPELERHQQRHPHVVETIATIERTINSCTAVLEMGGQSQSQMPMQGQSQGQSQMPMPGQDHSQMTGIQPQQGHQQQRF